MSEEYIASYRDNLDQILRKCVAVSLDAVETSIPKSLNCKPGKLNIEKVLLELLTREMEASVLPLVDNLLAVTDRVVSDIKRDNERLSEKLSLVEAKIAQLSSLGQPRQSVVPRNPFADIELLVAECRWPEAFGVASSVPRGIDFLLHAARIESAEDFFAANPIEDGRLALEICIAICKDLLSGDSIGIKVEMINELILGVADTNGSPAQFELLIQLLTQLIGVPGMPTAGRLSEILRIVRSTKRVVSVQSTPS